MNTSVLTKLQPFASSTLSSHTLSSLSISDVPACIEVLILGIHKTEEEWQRSKSQMWYLLQHKPVHIMFYRHGELDDETRQHYLTKCEIVIILCGNKILEENKGTINGYLLGIVEKIPSHIILPFFDYEDKMGGRVCLPESDEKFLESVQDVVKDHLYEDCDACFEAEGITDVCKL